MEERFDDPAVDKLGRPADAGLVGGPPQGLSPDLQTGPLEQLSPLTVKIRKGAPLLPFGGENSSAAEQYRIIRTKILQKPSRPRSLVMTSAESGDGKSVSAVNLAGVLALNPDFNVLLMDGDLHRSSLAVYFGVDSSPGAAEVIGEKANLSDAVRRIEPFPNLFFLPGGKSQTGPADLFNTSRWPALAAALNEQFDFCVIDAPPAGVFADFELIQAEVDGVVLVVREDHTNRMLWMRALQGIPPDKLIGVVMNCVQPWFLGKSFGYYQYYYYSKYYTGGA